MINLKNIQTEVDASYLYEYLASKEEDEICAKVFSEMSQIEKSHAFAFLEKSGLNEKDLPKPSWRAKTLIRIGKILGNDYILGALLDTEKSLSNNVLKARKSTSSKESISDVAHVTILKNIMNSDNSFSGNNLSRFEKRHKSVGGNALRAAVLGGNDGLVSNFSLVMGVAGAAVGQTEVLITGMAGLLAGALSMSLGEWISVKSSQELYENQMELEKEELEINPDAEEKELALIYMTKGIPEDQAKEMAAEIIKDKDKAHEVLVKEELGINSEELKGSAMEAAITSFLLFAIGAIIPVIPFFFIGGYKAVIISVILSTFGLFLIGAAITLFTGKNVWYSGFRQVLFGLAAAAITFAIGNLIGTSLV